MSDRIDDAANLAIFCDFENVAIGVREARFDEFDMHLVLERLLDKGRIVVKKAYADWERYKSARRALHEAAFELIEVPHVSYSGKNSADIRMVVDALDLCYVKHHVDVFVVVSGDSDFSPLVSKLRENNKRVIGLGVKSSTSDLLIENCDEFIYYDDLVRAHKSARHTSGNPKNNRSSGDKSSGDTGSAERSGRADDRRPAANDRGRPAEVRTAETRPAAPAPAASATSTGPVTATTTAPVAPAAPAATGGGTPSAARPTEKTRDERQLEALDLVLDVVESLFHDREGSVWGSMVKQTLKRKRPNFSEQFHGYRTFNELLEDAGRRGFLVVHLDEKSGGMVVSDFGPNA